MTPALLFALGLWREGPGGPLVYHEGPPMNAGPIVVHTGRSRRGGSCPVEIVLRNGWTHSAAGDMSLDETLVAAQPGPLTFTIGYAGLTSNPVAVRVRAR